MRNKVDYTTLAHRYTARYPLTTYVGTQTNFWIVANVLLIVLMTMQSRITSRVYHLPMGGRTGALLLIAVILGVISGLILGVTGYYLDRNVLKRLALGKVIVLKAIISFVVLVLILLLLRYVLYDTLISPSLIGPGTTIDDKAWEAVFDLLTFYYFFMSILLAFINQVNKKYGPGVLLPLLLGRFRNPKEEDRIFMFMDLRSSTATAEELGHLKYSAFIRDCFSDVNEVLYPCNAQVYQYVGDEVVVTWVESEGVKDHQCIRFYFECQRQFESRRQYYLDAYGLTPDFKAGVHAGRVTTVEIGDVKRDLAYHGDTLNTTSRIQSICNLYNKRFLVSRTLLDRLSLPPAFVTEDLGGISLKGKSHTLEIVSVERMTDVVNAHISN